MFYLTCYLDHGDQNVVCELCHAKYWKDAYSRGNKTGDKIFSLCCGYGKVELPPFKRATAKLQTTLS